MKVGSHAKEVFSLQVAENGDHSPVERPPSSASDTDGSEVTKESSEIGKSRWMNLALFSVLLLLVTPQLAFCLSQYIFVGGGGGHDLMASGSLVVSSVIAIVALGVLFGQAMEGKVEAKQHRFVLQEKPLNALLRNSLSLVGIVLFGPFACLLEMFQIFISVSCENVRRSYHHDDVGSYYIVDGAFHALHIVLMVLELSFCLLFRKIVFVRNSSMFRRFCVRLSLVVVAAVNLGIWFNIITYETSTSYKKKSPYSGSNNDTQRVPLKTYCSKTVFNGADDTVRHVLYPFTVEFCVLVLEYVTCHFIFEHDTPSTDEQKRLHALRQSNKSEEVSTTSNSFATTDGGQNDSQQDGGGGGSGGGTRRVWRFEPALIILLGVLPNLVCITLVFFANDGLMGAPYARQTVVVSLQYMSCYWTIMICLVIVGIACVRRCRYDVRVELNGFDYLVMLSAFGPFLGRVLRVIVIAENLEAVRRYVDPLVALLPEVLNLLQLVLQLPFVFYADSAKCTGENRKGITWRLFKAVILTLALWNITLWLIDSVLLRVDILVSIFEGTNWLYLDGIFRPLTIFFRFNSCLILLRAYLR